ncbi:uncharacterized protein LOC122808259 [Protopterus annectens]|uniref:uncharacterized protein LOC122808259 n=1 Tax=Protopterus annectens TaxID=7888 RepID=UPI001CFA39AE|nr:uncharacterized protein LOC122808259 [Protopterus annectens]
MGSGSSRRKKVASHPNANGREAEKPFTRSEAEWARGKSAVEQGGELGHRAHTLPKVVDYTKRSRGEPAWLSEEESDSDFSFQDEEDIDAELDRILHKYDEYELQSSRTFPKNTFTRSNTYSFCDTMQVYNGPSFSSTPLIHQRLDTRDRLAVVSEGAVSGNTRMSSRQCKLETNPPVAAWGKCPPEKNNKFTKEVGSQRTSGLKVNSCFDPWKFKEVNKNKALISKQKQDTENNNLPNQCPSVNEILPAIPAPVLYDYSEEELMASIEQEYC